MTAAAKEMVQSSSRLVDVAKSITIIVQNDFANDFSDFHGFHQFKHLRKR